MGAAHRSNSGFPALYVERRAKAGYRSFGLQRERERLCISLKETKYDVFSSRSPASLVLQMTAINALIHLDFMGKNCFLKLCNRVIIDGLPELPISWAALDEEEGCPTEGTSTEEMARKKRERRCASP